VPVLTKDQAAEVRRLRREGRPSAIDNPPPGWEVPRLWPGATCFVIGGGPSLRGVDLSPLHDRRVLGVNEAFKLGSWVDVMCYGDCRYGTQNLKELAEFGGLKITTCKTNSDPPPGIHYLNRMKRPHGISMKPAAVFWNMSSGGCAINIAVLLGSRRIVLLGFDMGHSEDSDGKRTSHWHDAYPDHGPRHNPYPKFLVPFASIKRDLDRQNIQCFNACPDSAIEELPKITVEEGLHVK